MPSGRAVRSGRMVARGPGGLLLAVLRRIVARPPDGGRGGPPGGDPRRPAAPGDPRWPTSRGLSRRAPPGGPPGDFRGTWRWDPRAVHHPAISTAPAVTIGGRHSDPQDNDWRGRFHGAPWGDGLPPWGWGAPPPPIWDGPLPEAWGPPPPPINYYGFNEQPVWDPGYNQWGSVSSGSGFRYRSDRQSGETAASDNPGAVVNASTQRVTDRQVFEPTHECRRDVLRVARQLDGFESR